MALSPWNNMNEATVDSVYDYLKKTIVLPGEHLFSYLVKFKGKGLTYVRINLLLNNDEVQQHERLIYCIVVALYDYTTELVNKNVSFDVLTTVVARLIEEGVITVEKV